MTPRNSGNQISPVSFLLGEDYFAKQEFLTQIKQTYGAKESFSREYLLADDVTPAQILDAARTGTLDLFSLGGENSKKLVVVDGAEELSNSAWKLMKDYFENPDTDTWLVFLINKRKKKWAPAKWVPPGTMIEYWPLRPDKVRVWLNRKARQQGVELTPSGAMELLKTVGMDRFALVGELEKLSVSYPKGKQIDSDDVLEVAGHSREFNIFDLGQQVLSGQTVAALHNIGLLLEQGEKPVRILAALIRYFRQVALAYGVLSQGGNNSEACQAAGVFWYKDKFIRNLQGLKGLSPRSIREGYELLQETDARLKGAGGPPRLELERATIKLGQILQKSSLQKNIG